MSVNNKKKEESIQSLDQQLLTFSALFEISQTLTSSLNFRSILKNILRIPMGHLLISRGIVLVRENESHDFIVEELKGLPADFINKILKIDTSLEHLVFLSNIKDNPEWIQFFQEFKIELLMPLLAGDGIVGVVGFGKKINGEDFKEQEIEFLNLFSNIAATAVNNGLNVNKINDVNRNLGRKVQQLNTIFDISRELNITLDKEKIASLMSFAIMGELLVNKSAVFIRDGNSMKPLVVKGTDPLIDTDPKLVEISEPLLLEDTERFKNFRQKGFSLIIPLRLKDETRGILMLGSKISGIEFSREDLEFLTTLGNQAITSLENARLFEETLEKQRMENELKIARTMQQKLLPSVIPQPNHYEIVAVNIPSLEVGGDYYDIITLDEGVYGITIADVSGKGAGAALLMSNLQAGLHALIAGELGIEEIISNLNNLIYQNTDLDKFITFFYSVLDTNTNSLTFCNAGHNPPYKLSKNGLITELVVGGIILGMIKDTPFNTKTVKLQPGDKIIMFTDGVTESMNEMDEEFEEKRLKKILEENAEENAQKTMEAIISAIKSFSGDVHQSDDVTLVVIKFEI